MRNVVLLLLVLRHLILLKFCARLVILIVVPSPGHQRALLGKLHDVSAHAVHEVLRMGREQQSVWIGFQVLLQPDARSQVQVVGGLIQQQQGRLDEQSLGQRHAHAPTAGHVLGVLVHHLLGEAEAMQELAGTGLERLGLHLVQLLTDDPEHLGVLLGVLLNELVDKLGQPFVLLRHHVDHRLDGSDLLWLGLRVQEPHVDVLRDRDLASCYRGQHGGLARAVLADQADATAKRQLQLGVIDELLAVHTQGELVDLDVPALLLGCEHPGHDSGLQDRQPLDVRGALQHLLLLHLVLGGGCRGVLGAGLGLGLGLPGGILLAAHGCRGFQGGARSDRTVS
mmetsp:Transcript_105600/g.275742  ORF Transcript_105600/g.275742 Transcript_105600/m.275742 type:complete len:339 (-) Transcript_105600:18-1034(-)